MQALLLHTARCPAQCRIRCIVGFVNSLRRSRRNRHTAVEVWLEELEQWVLLDPTHDTLVLVDGKVASAIQLHEAIVDGDLTRIAFERNGAALEPHPKAEFYACYCRHLFVAMSNAVFDGYAVRSIGRKRISSCITVEKPRIQNSANRFCLAREVVACS